MRIGSPHRCGCARHGDRLFQVLGRLFQRVQLRGVAGREAARCGRQTCRKTIHTRHFVFSPRQKVKFVAVPRYIPKSPPHPGSSRSGHTTKHRIRLTFTDRTPYDGSQCSQPRTTVIPRSLQSIQCKTNVRTFKEQNAAWYPSGTYEHPARK